MICLFPIRSPGLIPNRDHLCVFNYPELLMTTTITVVSSPKALIFFLMRLLSFFCTQKDSPFEGGEGGNLLLPVKAFSFGEFPNLFLPNQGWPSRSTGVCHFSP